jgi:hypothetical protein
MTTRLVHSEIIRRACDLYLAARAERITRERALLTEYYRGPYRRWFRWRHRTPTQARALAMKEEEWSDIEITGAHWEQRAENIRSLCLIPGCDQISLSQEDAEFLQPWVSLDAMPDRNR